MKYKWNDIKTKSNHMVSECVQRQHGKAAQERMREKEAEEKI